MVYLASPESSCTGNCTVGSNPTPSAMHSLQPVDRSTSCPAIQVLARVEPVNPVRPGREQR